MGETLGRRLYTAMVSSGWNQTELALRCGFQREQIGAFVNGEARPTLAQLQSLANAFGVSVEQLSPSAEIVTLETTKPPAAPREDSGQ